MNYGNLIRIALRALSNNKFRGFLTMLGIIIGVASVISMLAIGQGSKRSIREQISEMGSNMIMIHPGNGRFGGVRMSASDMETLKLEDYQSIVREVKLIDKCSPCVNASGQVIYGANNAPTTLYGVNRDYLDIRKFSVEDGEMFTDYDIIELVLTYAIPRRDVKPIARELLRRFKDDVSEVKAGTECGVGVKNYQDVRVGDQIEVFENVEIKRSL